PPGFSSPPPPPPPPPGGGLAATTEGYLCGQANRVVRKGFFEDVPCAVGGFFAPGEGRTLFQSDHCFDALVSPVSNPFHLVDPRSLTEIKPLFMWQHMPGSTPYGGGNIYYFGLQGGVALTDWLSFNFH